MAQSIRNKPVRILEAIVSLPAIILAEVVEEGNIFLKHFYQKCKKKIYKILNGRVRQGARLKT